MEHLLFCIVIFSQFVFLVLTLVMFAFLTRAFGQAKKFLITKTFKPKSEVYVKTTAIVKSTDKSRKNSVICYSVGEREFLVTVPYYILQESISVIYRKNTPYDVIPQNPSLTFRKMLKYFILSVASLAVGYLQMFGVLIAYVRIMESLGL